LAGFFSCASAPPPEEPAAPQPAAPAVPAPVPPPAPDPASPVDFSVERGGAREAREKALSIKADVASADLFGAAQTVLDEAESLAGSADAVTAGGVSERFAAAEQGFLAAYDDAYIKREEARNQLGLAREAIKRVEDEASLADSELRAAAEGTAE
jgi:hypothetical protein